MASSEIGAWLGTAGELVLFIILLPALLLVALACLIGSLADSIPFLD